MTDIKASIVIPYHPRENSERHLKKVLGGISEQGKYSIPNMGIDVIREGLKTYRKTVGQAEALIVTDWASPPDSRKNICHKINVGLQMSYGEVFVLNQQDVIASPGAIEKMVEHVLRNPHDVVFAKVFREGVPNDAKPVIGVGPTNRNRLWWLIAANRQKIIDLGGIDEDLRFRWGFDDTLSVHYWEKHLNVIYVDWAVGLHLYHPQDPGCNMESYQINQELYFNKMTNPNYAPNKGKKWGVVFQPPINKD